MSKFKLKDGTNAKSVVHYRVPKMKEDDKPKLRMIRIVLSEATNKQFEHLAKLNHPFIEEAVAKKPGQ